MKIQINRNIYWAQLLAKQLSELGVKDVCISPGSRSTALTYSFATNPSFNKYVTVDERSSGYFALGLAKQSKLPVAVVTTSGTAVAELYPAIIEAYSQRIPLIICTADRPDYLRNTGANQTINQENIYSNHIRYFYDTGLPSVEEKKISDYLDKIVEGFNVSNHINKGPVHFNFPFEKPFEPDSFTDEIDSQFEVLENNFSLSNKTKTDQKIFEKINQAEKVIAVIGPNNFGQIKLSKIEQVLNEKNIPLLADSASGVRFIKDNNSICNHTAFLRMDNLFNLTESDVILLLGEPPVSNSVLTFIEKNNCFKISVNKFGDLKDPSRTVDQIVPTDENIFFEDFSKFINPKENKFLKEIKSLDQQSEKIKTKLLKDPESNIESNICGNIIDAIPENSNLFIGNSTVIRDFDLFSGKSDKNIKTYSNRGTSGIEGNIATALGIAEKSQNPTFLVLGDLSFYYDSNSLLIAKQNKIPLTIIVVNNNGGGIFSMLPVSDYSEVFEKYFTTPLNLDFKHFADLYDGKHYFLDSSKQISEIIKSEIDFSMLNILEIKTDSAASTEFRKSYIRNIRESLTIDAN